MEAITAVDKEIERVLLKFKGIKEYSQSMLGNFIKIFKDLQDELNEHCDSSDPENEQLTLEQNALVLEKISKLNTTLHALSTDHRELHGAVSKVGKVIDRNFVSDFSALSRNAQSEENLLLLNRVMAKHYHRQGMDEISNLIIKESDMPVEYASEVFESKSKFAEIYDIWIQTSNYNLTPALQWSEQYSDELDKINSSLQFELHRLAFLQILADGIGFQSKAVTYARKNFAKHIGRFEKEIQHLMGTFIYLPNGISNSPYKNLISNDAWTEASYIFLKDACTILGISKNSALSVVVDAGCTALPALLNIKQVMLSRQVHGIWSDRDELPIEIDLDPEFRYHSIFACPILRQQTSDDNPPKKLTCGHVISNDALHKLSNGSNVLKCPYCPVEQHSEDAVRISF